MHKDSIAYNAAQSASDQTICAQLAAAIAQYLPEAENKVWHGHPVWFLEGNPIVGYSRRKAGLQLLFWSGQGFEEEGLKAEGKFKAATVLYTSADQINSKDLRRWLTKAKSIQWDYKNIVKRRGVLERIV